jgi:DivIVA domain-containing protein
VADKEPRGDGIAETTRELGDRVRAVPADALQSVPSEIRDPSFGTAVRGYHRRAVDDYVVRVNGLIAELQVSGSPRAAVRHALERVGEQTSGILERARDTAEEITASARQEAEERTARARAEADEVRAGAREEAAEAISAARGEADEIAASARTEAAEVLRRAQDEAETALARARIEAEARIRRAEQESAGVREEADEAGRAMRADIAAIAAERRRACDELRAIAARISGVVDDCELRPEGVATPDGAGG